MQHRSAAGSNDKSTSRYSPLPISFKGVVLSYVRILTSLDRTEQLRQIFLDREHYSTAAKRTGIAQCIKRNKKDPEFHRKGIDAIIAAVLLDSFDRKMTLMATLRYIKMPLTYGEAWLILCLWKGSLARMIDRRNFSTLCGIRGGCNERQSISTSSNLACANSASTRTINRA